MALDPATLPDDISVLKAMLIASEARSDGLDAEIAHLKLTIAKMKRDEFGASSEKGARLIDQLEMQLGELVATASEGKAATAIERPASTPTSSKSASTLPRRDEPA